MKGGVGMRRLVAILLALPFVGARGVVAQAQASLGAGVGTARYPGGATLSTAALSPSLTIYAPTVSTTLAGSLASLPNDVWSRYGRADLWAVTSAAARGPRLGLEGTLTGTSRTDGVWTAAAGGVGELVLSSGGAGVAIGAGPTAGWIVNAPSVVALHTRARLWWRDGPSTWALSVDPTRFLGAWYTDVTGNVGLSGRVVTASAWGVLRVSQAYGSKGGGGALVRIFATPTLALEAGAGSFLADPYQGFPRTRYLNAGLRVYTPWHARAAAPAPTPQPSPRLRPLAPLWQGDSAVVRFRMERANTVAIAGDWNGWQTVALQPLGGDQWQGVFALAPGTYRFTLLVDGRDWVVPGGVAIERDSTGSMVALLVVR